MGLSHVASQSDLRYLVVFVYLQPIEGHVMYGTVHGELKISVFKVSYKWQKYFPGV